jgi:hypothetical protein
MAPTAVSPKSVLQAYFLAAANIFEPDRATERLGWARTAVLADAVSSHLRGSASADSTRAGFIAKLTGDRRNNEHRFVVCRIHIIKAGFPTTAHIFYI